MTRDYKNTTASREKPASKGSPFLSGLLIGLLLGVGASVALVIFINGGTNPFVNKVEPGAKLERKDNSDAPIETDNGALPNGKTPESEVTDDGKARFDFYTILPENESKVTEQEVKLKEAESAAKIVNESYFLQVGAFQNETDADNQKAKLALLGLEAIVQTAEIPSKGIWHRVRVGPFADLDQINKARKQLESNGFKADLLKVNVKQEKESQ